MARRTRREEAAEAVRSAVDRTVHATVGPAQFGRDRAQELVDELAATAGRVREAFEELRPPAGEELRALQARIEELEARVGELESRRRPARASASGKSAPRRKPGGQGAARRSPKSG
jgi:polyhydroxyalkanoate synthesis regulator phasin